jgi:hypothetical protein
MPNHSRAKALCCLLSLFLGACSAGTSALPASPDKSSDASVMTVPSAEEAGVTSTVDAAQVWENGTVLSSNVTIGPGATVTIVSGAAISLASGVTIRVEGTLSGATATGAHASLSGPPADTWGGLFVANGGSLDLNGVDLVGADTAIHVAAGATMARYDNGSITGATVPFSVDVGGTLDTTGATVSMPQSSSEVAGSLVASHLTYKAGASEAITTNDVGAKVSIEDSTFVGGGPVADMIVSESGASLHVAYSDISAAHCGFHFDSIGTFDISYTNIHDNAYGFMLYGSGTSGSRTVSYSNVQNSDVAFDAEGTNGAITFDHSFVTGAQNTNGTVSVTNAQPNAVVGTGPRSP